MDDIGIHTLIAEFDILEFQLAPDIRQPFCFMAFIFHFLLVQEFKDPFAGGSRRLQPGGHLGKILERMGEEPDVHHEGDNGAEGDLSPEDQDTPQDADGNKAQISHEEHHGHHHGGEGLGLEGGGPEPAVDPVKGFTGPGLAVIGTDNIMAGVDLLDVAVHVPQVPLLGDKVLAGGPDGQGHEEETQHGDADRGQGHQDIGQKHHGQGAEEESQGGADGGDALVEGLADPVHVVGDPAQDIPVGHPVEVIDGHLVDLLPHLPPHAFGDGLGDRGHEEVLGIVEKGGKPVDDNQPGDQDPDGRKVHRPRDPLFNDVDDLGQAHGTDQGQDGPDGGPDEGTDNGDPFRAAVHEKAAPGFPEILGFLDRPADPTPAASHLGLALDAGCISNFVFLLAHDTNSSMDSWERAISW